MRADLIDRQAAIEEIAKSIEESVMPEYWYKGMNVAMSILQDLPPAQETHEKRMETHACDCVSRQAAIDMAVDMYVGGSIVQATYSDIGKALVKFLNLVPSAQPEQRWIDTIREVIKYSGSDGFIIVPKDGMEGWDASGVHYMIQPEIIRCKDCRFHEHEQPGMVYCPAVVGGWVEDDWFYKGGERRTE